MCESPLKDFCTYWFRKSQDHLRPGQRAGLVGTNSISQNQARSVSLDYIMQSGGTITDAVSTQKWPGDAKVHVSLVNWIKAPSAGPATLNGLQVEGIDSSLRPSSMDDWRPRVLLHNRLRCFQGPIPVGAGFVLGDVEARQLLDIVDRDYRDVVRPYLTANDIARIRDRRHRAGSSILASDRSRKPAATRPPWISFGNACDLFERP